ncbi:MAG: 30S ribosomal protein S21 [Elusimicrobiota bacterium]
MVFVKVRDNESIEEALRRFKRECERNGILKEIKRREHYLTPSVKRKLKQQETLRKLRRLRRKRSARSS